jgi:hypothetical protein
MCGESEWGEFDFLILLHCCWVDVGAGLSAAIACQLQIVHDICKLRQAPPQQLLSQPTTDYVPQIPPTRCVARGCATGKPLLPGYVTA